METLRSHAARCRCVVQADGKVVHCPFSFWSFIEQPSKFGTPIHLRIPLPCTLSRVLCVLEYLPFLYPKMTQNSEKDVVPSRNCLFGGWDVGAISSSRILRHDRLATTCRTYHGKAASNPNPPRQPLLFRINKDLKILATDHPHTYHVVTP